MTSMNQIMIEKEPFWLLEAVQCMNGVYMLDSDEWLNEKSRWSRKQKEEFLQPYRRFRDAMREELTPLFERYPAIMAQLEAKAMKSLSLETLELPLIEFLRFNCDIFASGRCPEEEKLRLLINRCFERMLSNELHTILEDEDTEVHCLTDVMKMVENWDAEESYKFKMIRLYVDLPSLMEPLYELQKAAIEAGRKNLSLVQEHYDRFYAMLEKIHTPKELFEELDTMQMPDNICYHIWPGIISCQGIILHGDEEESKKKAAEIRTEEMACFLGIDVLYTIRSKRESGCDDESFAKKLKAISDPTRLRILRLLAEEPDYLQGLAKKLELTPATVSHHLNTLIDMELIAISLESGKKIYYRVLTDKLRELGENVRLIGISSKERKEEQDQKKESQT